MEFQLVQKKELQPLEELISSLSLKDEVRGRGERISLSK